MDDQQKSVLITGATSGIGKELAKLFAADNYNLVIVARDIEQLKKTAAELNQQYGIRVHTIAKDLFKPSGPFEVYDEVKASGIEIGILVNDAGQGEYGEFINTDLPRELDIIRLNINAYVVLTKLFLKDMVKNNSGKILNVGSIAGEAPGPLHSVYHGTKAFVNSWSEAINNELRDTNITVTVLLPGATDTDFFNKANMTQSKIVQEGNLGDAVKVAKDGYEALMKGDDKVISGFKNKVQVAMGNILSDKTAAENMRKQQEPTEQED